MDFVIFGNTKSPDLSFCMDPKDGRLNIESSTNHIVYGATGELSIDWWYLIMSTSHLHCTPSYPNWDEGRTALRECLLPIAATKGEKVFLEAYLKISSDGHKYPALIPQTWVNWLHYSPNDPERAKRTKKEPFRVDFTMYVNNRKIVIEIDGSSHFSEIFDIDGAGKIRYEASMDKYTEHLRKDRWLRSMGWEVWRFSEAEVLDKDFDISMILKEMKIGKIR